VTAIITASPFLPLVVKINYYCMNAGVWEMQGSISQYQRMVMDRNMDCERKETWEGVVCKWKGR
jgi:hypothetical protein